MARKVEGSMWTIKLLRPLDEIPCIIASPEDICDYYMTSPSFFTTDGYPVEVYPAKGEVGFIGLAYASNAVYPVVRIVNSESYGE